MDKIKQDKTIIVVPGVSQETIKRFRDTFNKEEFKLGMTNAINLQVYHFKDGEILQVESSLKNVGTYKIKKDTKLKDWVKRKLCLR